MGMAQTLASQTDLDMEEVYALSLGLAHDILGDDEEPPKKRHKGDGHQKKKKD